MIVTRQTDYAVRCVLYLAREQDQVSSVGEIAKQMQIPKSFLAKILQCLAREGIAESIRGMKGGFRLLKPSSEITLLDVFIATQGVAPVNSCAIDKRRCRIGATCAVHPVWTEIRREVERRLGMQTLASLMEPRQVMCTNVPKQEG
jgi:Rrf2 family nitric oxide-sensitive transcriptional repressor